MNEREFDSYVARVGVAHAQRVLSTLHQCMPTLPATTAGLKAQAFLAALQRAIERASSAFINPENQP